MMSIVQANKLKKNKLVVELSIPLGTKNNNATLQVPIIPNNHSIHSLIPFPSHGSFLYAIKCFTTSTTYVNFSYATNPKATVKPVTINPFIISSSSFYRCYLHYRGLTICYHRTTLQLPYRIVRFQREIEKHPISLEVLSRNFSIITCKINFFLLFIFRRIHS